MYGYGNKPKRPHDLLDRVIAPPATFQSPEPPSSEFLPDIPPINDFGGGLNPRTTLNRPQMERDMPKELTAPDMPVGMPNRPARPVSRDPIQRAREEAIYGGQMQADLDIKPKRGFWDILKTAGVGALQGMASGGGLGGALGGALAGGVMSAASPEAGRGYRFDVLQRPRMEADIQRQMAYAKFNQDRMRGQAELEQTIAQTGKTRAETEAIPGREELNREAIRSRIRREGAQTERYQRPPEPRRTPQEEQRAEEMHKARLGLIGAQTSRAQRPPSSGGGGGGGADSDRRPAQMRYQQALKALQTAKQLAGRAAAVDDDELHAQAASALQIYNDMVNELVDLYPEMFEGGIAPNQTWAYIKPRR